MEIDNIYIVYIAALFLLAISDLVVGVSNDAVNFLNSAIGSKVASRRTILIVAAIGITIGATFSSGMMEVARKGIFNPEMYFFVDLMTIFMAVMLTDVILLDLFNTFGMPTSTTVSIVFELLGASFFVAVIKIFSDSSSLALIGDYINYQTALLIIGGIFLSVFIAFSIGWFVQVVSRIIFTFNYKKNLKRYGAFFGGFALTIIVYFMLIKGAKGSSFLTSDIKNWINENTFYLIIGNLVFWTIFSQLLISLFKVNILKFIVLAGTFSLAMAFAGNDLVNFIGVPIAGLESYKYYVVSGIPADELNMGFLAGKVKTDTWLLLVAGLVMVLSLVFSKKARSVTETEVQLGRQGEGSERFQPNLLSRALVKVGLGFGKSSMLISKSLNQRIESRFISAESDAIIGGDKPAFDLVRASVNLMVASVLIAFATSLKLPLSTTYVSFMVAMGTSLADRAWDRESAVYRVAGVLNVIGGWMLTALIAFSSAGIIAVIIYFWGIYAVVILMFVAAFLIFKSHGIHLERVSNRPRFLFSILSRKRILSSHVLEECQAYISNTINDSIKIYSKTFKGLNNSDAKKLKSAKKEVKQLNSHIAELWKSAHHYIKRIEGENVDMANFYIKVLDHLQDFHKSTRLIVKSTSDYIDNLHKPFTDEQLAELDLLQEKLFILLTTTEKAINNVDKTQQIDIQDQANEVLQTIEVVLGNQMKRIKNRVTGKENSSLFFMIVLETKDLVKEIVSLSQVFKRYRIIVD
jgi:phosphate/sulfate permease